jgi:hypothetical protein
MSSRAPQDIWKHLLTSTFPAEHVYKLHLYVDDPLMGGLEVKGFGYAPKTLTGHRIEGNGTEAVLRFDTNLIWDNADIKSRYAVVRDETAGQDINVMDFGKHIGVTGGIFEVRLSDEGVFRLGEPT